MMAIRPRNRPGPRLVVLFVIATLLPAGAVGWFGWLLLDWDVRLERQRVQDLQESTADRVAAVIERELGALERRLGSTARTPDAGAGPLTVMVRVDREGHTTTLGGLPLMYDLGRPLFPDEPSRSPWAEIERLEIGAGNAIAAIDAYRSLARSPDPQIRAGSLLRLARALRSAGRPDDALNVYSELVSVSGATVLGDPADLVGRRSRVELLASLGRDGAARAEAAALDADLRGARWRLARTSMLAHARALRPWRSDADEARWATEAGLAEAVFALWREWTSNPGSILETGRRAFSERGERQLVVWRNEGETLAICSTDVPLLVRSWEPLWTTPGLSVTLLDDQGRSITSASSATAGTPAIRTAADTKLPWGLRVVATTTPADIVWAGVSRRQIIVATLILIGFLVPATGYLVIRAVHRELVLARQQSDFVAAISHEFRSPLTSLSHLTALLRSDFQPSEERRRQYYDTLARETERLRTFVENLLDIRRIEAGVARYRRTPVEMQPLVAQVIEDFRRQATAGTHALTLRAPDAPITSAVDPEAVHRAIWNLLENAAKYSPVDSPIAAVLEMEGERVAIRVIDRGPGIPPEEQPFIFDQFFRGAAATESAVRGTGIGLALVKHIVEAHGGEVRLESSVGAGSTFTILLPVAAGAATSGETRRAS
jgi:signal transduction histidine kinase